MYLECLSCPKLGVSCDGPNFVAMTAHELIEWCKERKKRLGMSNAKLSELSGMPKGTIDRLFAGTHADFKYETMRPLVRVLVGGEWNGNPCPNPDAHVEEELHKIEDENAKLKDAVQHHKEDINAVKAEYLETIRFLRGQVKDKKIAVVTLSIVLGLSLAAVFGFLIADILNPNIGFFWLQ